MKGIAVVIPCCNMGRTLGDTLESVFAQTRPAAEIVIVDDGSTDAYTLQVLSRMARPRTRVVRTPNQGPSAARNHGIRLTTAPYIFPLDADDLLDPTYFEKAGQRLDADPGLGFVSCAVQAFEGASYLWVPPACTMVNLLTRGGPHVESLFRRELWEAVGGFDETFRNFEIRDFWTSALELGFPGEVLQEPLVRYRVQRGSNYQKGIEPAAIRATSAAFLAKHRRSVETHAAELLVAHETFLAELRTYHAGLEHKKRELERELASLQDSIADAVRSLDKTGGHYPDWGEFRRLSPVRPAWGVKRGKPLDRYYIERFLGKHSRDIRGRALEVKDSGYTDWFGGAQVVQRDVLDIVPTNARATIVADLCKADNIPSGTYDCITLTQTLHLIYDVRAAVSECVRILKEGGVLLATLPCTGPVDFELGLDGDFWRFTEASARKLFAEFLPLDAFEIVVMGNVMACAGFLYGLTADELAPEELNHTDPHFPLIICIRAVKPKAAAPIAGRQNGKSTAGGRLGGAAEGGAILYYHRIASLDPDTHRLCVSPAQFRAHMEQLRRHYQPMAVEDLVSAAAVGRIPERAVAVTLDDGYLDALEAASGILLECGVPATFYVNTERLDEEHERWWDVLERVFLSGSRIPEALALRMRGQAVRLPTATHENKASTLKVLNDAVRTMSREERDDLVGRVVEWAALDIRPRPTHRLMTGGEVLRLSQRPGHSIGAHSTHHLSLPAQPLAVQRDEVFENKLRLERLLERPVLTFSYPYGELKADTVEVVRAAAFAGAVTVKPGLVLPGGDPMLLPRYGIAACDAESFAQRMSDIFSAAGVPASR